MSWLRSVRLPTVFVLHANHPNEIDSDVSAACEKLRASGVTLLNQSVLLRGVNDDVEVLAELSRRLFDTGVLPYYLHVLDRVRGAAHFEIPEAQARLIAGDLATRLPGYLVPRLVREIYGAPAKVTLTAAISRVETGYFAGSAGSRSRQLRDGASRGSGVGARIAALTLPSFWSAF